MNPSPPTYPRIGQPQYEPESIKSADLLSELIHKVGHDIGNPLTAIISLATIIERFGAEKPADASAAFEKFAGYATSIIDEAWKISALNERLVMLLSNRSGNLSACDMTELISRTAKRIRSRTGSKIPISLKQTGKPNVRAWADPDQLNILFGELLKNALLFTAQIQAQQDPAVPPETVHVTIHGGDSTATVSIRNALQNSLPEDICKIFEPFITEHTDRKHLGLGLPVAWTITKRFGGSLKVIENLENGLRTFSIEAAFPAYKE